MFHVRPLALALLVFLALMVAYWTGWTGAPPPPGAGLHTAFAADCAPGSPEGTVESCQPQPGGIPGSGPQIDPNGSPTGTDR